MGEQAATYWDGKSRNLYYSKVRILVLFLITFPDSEIEGAQLLLDDEHPQQLAVPRIIFGRGYVSHIVFPYSMILYYLHGEYNTIQ